MKSVLMGKATPGVREVYIGRGISERDIPKTVVRNVSIYEPIGAVKEPERPILQRYLQNIYRFSIIRKGVIDYNRNKDAQKKRVEREKYVKSYEAANLLLDKLFSLQKN